MSGERFVYYEHKGVDYILDTPNTELDFIEMLGDALETEEICEKLNEQQATIERLEKENIELKKYKEYCAEWMGVKEENLSLRCVKISEKRFKTKYYLKSRQGVVLGVVKVNEEENVLHWNDVVDLLNEMNEDIQYLNAFLVEQGLAEEYIRWKGDD